MGYLRPSLSLLIVGRTQRSWLFTRNVSADAAPNPVLSPHALARTRGEGEVKWKAYIVVWTAQDSLSPGTANLPGFLPFMGRWFLSGHEPSLVMTFISTQQGAGGSQCWKRHAQHTSSVKTQRLGARLFPHRYLVWRVTPSSHLGTNRQERTLGLPYLTPARFANPGSLLHMLN